MKVAWNLLLAAGPRFLVSCCWLLVTGYLSLAGGPWSLVTGHGSAHWPTLLWLSVGRVLISRTQRGFCLARRNFAKTDADQDVSSTKETSLLQIFVIEIPVSSIEYQALPATSHQRPVASDQRPVNIGFMSLILDDTRHLRKQKSK